MSTTVANLQEGDQLGGRYYSAQVYVCVYVRMLPLLLNRPFYCTVKHGIFRALASIQFASICILDNFIDVSFRIET